MGVEPAILNGLLLDTLPPDHAIEHEILVYQCKIGLKFKCNRIILNCISIFGGDQENRFPEVFLISR
jgi:hypothetical protein